jgi:hypothetical protein
MTLQGLHVHPTHLQDVHSLRLKTELLPEIENILHSHKLEWELWIESANDYTELRNKLMKRGCKGLPIKIEPLHSESSINNPHVADTRSLVRKVMVQKAN